MTRRHGAEASFMAPRPYAAGHSRSQSYDARRLRVPRTCHIQWFDCLVQNHTFGMCRMQTSNFRVGLHFHLAAGTTPRAKVYRPPHASCTQTQSPTPPGCTHIWTCGLSTRQMRGRVVGVSSWLYAWLDVRCTNTVDRSWQSISKLPACVPLTCASATSLQLT